MREVNALLGFTRIEAPEETQDPDKRPPRASLSKHDPTWVPVMDVHGEGIFIRFKEEVVKAWEEDDTVKVENAFGGTCEVGGTRGNSTQKKASKRKVCHVTYPFSYFDKRTCIGMWL